MRILILEDDAERNRKLRHALIGHDATFTTTAAEAIEALSKFERFDVASLDHDLGGGQMLPSDEQSGYAVAEFIVSMGAGKWPTLIIVHSFNPAGAKRMCDCLSFCEAIEIRRAAFGTPLFWASLIPN
ncbi:MAG TPA: cyclic-phosphate processing receiver domain-containing protein [Blastocatellia bacterium]|nr:cyclic-phosphate processing receiver domain-containing protein [Blastocatellia bacterium]